MRIIGVYVATHGVDEKLGEKMTTNLLPSFFCLGYVSVASNLILLVIMQGDVDQGTRTA